MQQVPQQQIGKSIDYSRELTLKDKYTAYQRYLIIVNNLMQVNHWKDIARGISAEFLIVNSQNEIQNRNIKKGDFIRINIPGPGLPSKAGYDWVEVTQMQVGLDGDNSKTVITLQPSADPTSQHNDIAHFYKHFSSSNILIQLKGNKIILKYAGRNEVINKDSKHLLDNLRNIIIGIAAKVGASFPQWKALIDGLYKKD